MPERRRRPYGAPFAGRLRGEGIGAPRLMIPALPEDTMASIPMTGTTCTIRACRLSACFSTPLKGGSRLRLAVRRRPAQAAGAGRMTAAAPRTGSARCAKGQNLTETLHHHIMISRSPPIPRRNISVDLLSPRPLGLPNYLLLFQSRCMDYAVLPLCIPGRHHQAAIARLRLCGRVDLGQYTPKIDPMGQCCFGVNTAVPGRGK